MPKSIEVSVPQSMNLPPVSRLLMGFAVKVARWEMNRRTRKSLEKLDDHLLRDVGLTQNAAQKEWDKPLWW